MMDKKKKEIDLPEKYLDSASKFKELEDEYSLLDILVKKSLLELYEREGAKREGKRGNESTSKDRRCQSTFNSSRRALFNKLKEKASKVSSEKEEDIEKMIREVFQIIIKSQEDKES